MVVAAVCVVLSVLIALSGALGHNLLKAYRLNRYSKNIWLGNNYFLAKYEKDISKDSGVYAFYPYRVTQEIESIMGSSEETNFDEISEGGSSSYLDSVIYDMYIKGNLSDDDVYQIYIMIREGRTDEAVNAINESAGEELLSIDLITQKLSVPYVSQEGILPNGCEAVSGVMLLRDKGFDVDPVDFVNNYLDCGEVKVRWGCRYGPDPSKQYAGDPKSEKGGLGLFRSGYSRFIEQIYF